MTAATINIGILAHVDAGKTSLSERLLFDHGAIQRLGSVSEGTTTTDSGDIERQRGITIRAAVASFWVDNLQVNLIDTPGHPDFIAEVDRSLSVIDGAVLVVSAVQGVQAQTRVLMKSLSALKLPTTIFVNKIDQRGARPEEVKKQIEALLRLKVIPCNTVKSLGDQNASVAPIGSEEREALLLQATILTDNDPSLLQFLVDGGIPTVEMLAPILRAQTVEGLVKPVYFGSALTGAGVPDLSAGLKMFCRPLDLTPDNNELRGRIFAIERGDRGEKIAYARLYAGKIQERDRVECSRHERNGNVSKYETLITGLELVSPNSRDKEKKRGGAILTTGNIGKIIGPNNIKVGDYLGKGEIGRVGHNFSPPNLEAIVRPQIPSDAAKLNTALLRLAEEDPLISAHLVEGGAMALLLYGEVQREVIAAKLLRYFGVEAVFDKVRPVYFERPAGIGQAFQEMDHRGGPNRFFATIGLRVEPGVFGSGIVYDNKEHFGHLPLAFHKAVEETVHLTLTQGLYGWQVTDCNVTMTHAGYGSSVSTAADFRQLTPLIIMEALRGAGSKVYEPYHNFELEMPSAVFGVVSSKLSALGADIAKFSDNGAYIVIQGGIPAREVQQFLETLPGLTQGQGAWLAYPGEDQPTKGQIPVRARTDGNPLNRDEYMLHLSGRTGERKREKDARPEGF